MSNEFNWLEYRPHLKGINNLKKIPGIDFMTTQFNYIMYHLLMTNVATIDQLLEVIDAERNPVNMSLIYAVNNGFVGVEAFSFNGLAIKYYYLTIDGRKEIANYMDMYVDDFKVMQFKRHLKHFIEASDIYYSVFKDCYDIEINREAKKSIGDVELFRPDLDMELDYGHFSDKFSIEHDRATERNVVVMDKLNRYALYMLPNNNSNIIFTVSKEANLNRTKTLEISRDSKIKNFSRRINALKKIRMIMNKLELNEIDDLKHVVSENLSNGHIYSGSYVYRLIQDNKCYIEDFLGIDYQFKFQNKEEVKNKIYEFETQKSVEYLRLIRASIDKFEMSRVNKIKDSIKNMSSRSEIDDKTYRKLYRHIGGKGEVDWGKIYVPSYKELIYQNEFIIGPLYDIKRYMKNRTKKMTEGSGLFQRVFGIPISNFKYGEVNFKTNDRLLRKNINAGVGRVGNQTVALIILEPSINLADEMKLDIINRSSISHNFDRLIFAVMDSDLNDVVELIEK